MTELNWPDDYINKVICGDCLEVMKGIPDGAVDLVVTDPPYGMAYVSARRKRQHDAIEGDIDLSWFPDFVAECFRVMRDNSHLYVCCNDYAISDFRRSMAEVGFTPKRTLVWVKNNHTSGDLDGDYANKTEFVLFAHKGRLPLSGRRDTNVLTFDRVSTDFHPTEKPVPMAAYMIGKSSLSDQIILDPFAGSGTTLVAAKQLGRKYIGIEINPDYCKIAEQRLAQEELFG